MPTSRSSALEASGTAASSEGAGAAGIESDRITSQLDSCTSVEGVADGDPCPTIDTSLGLRNKRSKVSRSNRLPTSKKMRIALAAASPFTRSIQPYLLAEKRFLTQHTRRKQKPRS